MSGPLAHAGLPSGNRSIDGVAPEMLLASCANRSLGVGFETRTDRSLLKVYPSTLLEAAKRISETPARD